MRSDLLTVAEAATLARVSPRTVQGWCKADRISHGRTPGGAYRIPRGVLMATLEPAPYADDGEPRAPDPAAARAHDNATAQLTSEGLE